jgi:hypothetical protein
MAKSFYFNEWCSRGLYAIAFSGVYLTGNAISKKDFVHQLQQFLGREVIGPIHQELSRSYFSIVLNYIANSGNISPAEAEEVLLFLAGVIPEERGLL